MATGVIGCTLGVAMLWLMLSDVSNRPSREPIAMRSTNTVVPPLTASFVAGPNVAGPAIARGTPSNTALLRSRIQVPDSTTAKAIAVAVLVNGSPMLITTANAVSGRLGAFDITLDADGAARVVVDTVDRSLAYLRPTGGTEDLSAIERLQATGFKTAAMAAPGDTLFVLTDKPVAVIFADRLDLSDVLDGAVAEGTPVVDGSGALVALCTIHDGVTQMLSVLPEPTG